VPPPAKRFRQDVSQNTLSPMPAPTKRGEKKKLILGISDSVQYLSHQG